MTWVDALVLATAGFMGGIALSGLVRSVIVKPETGPRGTPRGVMVLLFLGALALAATVLVDAGELVDTALLFSVLVLVGGASVVMLKRGARYGDRPH